MREPAPNVHPSMPFERGNAREAVGFAEPGDVPAWRKTAGASFTKSKNVPITESREVSRHIVDLTPFSPRRSFEGPRPSLNFEQKINVLAHTMTSAVPSVSDEHRSFMPLRPGQKKVRASIIGFLKLPFSLMTLPFKPRPVNVKLVRKNIAVAPTPKIAAPAPRVMPAPRSVITAPAITVMPGVVQSKFAFLPQADWVRRLAVFVVIALVVSLPLQALLSYSGLLAKAGAIAANAQAAVGGLRDAGDATLKLDGSAAASFGQAAGAFAETRERVGDISVRLAAMFTGNGEKLASGERLLTAGEDASRAGAELAAGLDAMHASQESVAKKLEHMSVSLAAALPHLEAASESLDGVSVGSLPKTFREPFSVIRKDIAASIDDVKRASASSGVLLDAIGASGKRRYLVVFQNSDELRPTGGFIGSFALMDLEDGEIKKIEIPAGGSYDLRGGLNQRIAAPSQLRLVNPRWEFQDANWFADFPSSAQALTWFYEKSGGPTVDGVIAVTSNLMQDLLREVGPIDMPEYGKTMTAENFQVETQKSVEFEYDHEENRPKQIISDMAPKLLKKLLDGGASDLPALAGVLGKALASKDIQVYFEDADAQSAAEGFGWTGALAPLPNADFLSIVDTNIAGGKTDGVIHADINHEMRVENDGSILDTVTITRTHLGMKDDLFTGIKNIDYLRLYVPRGSVLVSAEGFAAPGEGYFLPQDDTLQPSTFLAAVEGAAISDPSSGTRVSEESGLTVFGNWIQLEPGESRSVKVSYRLPFRMQDLVRAPETRFDHLRQKIGAWSETAALKLIVRKQPGANDRTFMSRMIVPDAWRIRSSMPALATENAAGLSLTAPLDHDLYVAALLVNRK